jgi:NADPH:quinone reductase-like Zn-dependent oxidoreductase
MRAVRVRKHGGPEELVVEEFERPTPGEDELLVKVHAAGINPVDTYFRDGSYTPVELPFTPGSDLAGVVVETGEKVTGFEVDDRIYGTGIGNGSYQGAYAEYATIPEDRIAQLPDGVDATEAGAAGIAAGTAWRALIEQAALNPAEDCLIHGGSGGVGHTAVQIAAAVNARVTTTAAPEYHDRVIELGADAVLDYRQEDLVDAIRETTDGGVDVVLDHRLDDYLQLDADVAGEGARVVGIGENRSDPGFTNDGVARSKDVSYQFMLFFNAPNLQEILNGVAHLMETGAPSVEIANTYDLAEASDAQRDVMEESFLGKLAIVP